MNSSGSRSTPTDDWRSFRQNSPKPYRGGTVSFTFHRKTVSTTRWITKKKEAEQNRFRCKYFQHQQQRNRDRPAPGASKWKLDFASHSCHASYHWLGESGPYLPFMGAHRLHHSHLIFGNLQIKLRNNSFNPLSVCWGQFMIPGMLKPSWCACLLGETYFEFYSIHVSKDFRTEPRFIFEVQIKELRS